MNKDIIIFYTAKDACKFIMSYEGCLRIKKNGIYSGSIKIAEFHIKNNYSRRLFEEKETSFGILAKIPTKDLESNKDNMNLSSENRARVNYELKIRNINLPEELIL